jgi:hypothetical protein
MAERILESKCADEAGLNADLRREIDLCRADIAAFASEMKRFMILQGIFISVMTSGLTVTLVKLLP